MTTDRFENGSTEENLAGAFVIPCRASRSVVHPLLNVVTLILGFSLERNSPRLNFERLVL